MNDITEQHSPLPWRMVKASIGGARKYAEEDHLIYGDDNRRIADVLQYQSGICAPAPTKENAEFILLAVNNHEALITAFETMLDNHPHFGCDGGEDCMYRKHARRVIANARGETPDAG